jgi:hypothetical protein
MTARPAAAAAACPSCGETARRVHGRYQRVLRDAPLAGTPVAINLTVRRFVCDTAACDRRTFREQVPGLTTPHARFNPPLRHALTTVAVALAQRGTRQGPTPQDPRQNTIVTYGMITGAVHSGHCSGCQRSDHALCTS